MSKRNNFPADILSARAHGEPSAKQARKRKTEAFAFPQTLPSPQTLNSEPSESLQSLDDAQWSALLDAYSQTQDTPPENLSKPRAKPVRRKAPKKTTATTKEKGEKTPPKQTQKHSDVTCPKLSCFETWTMARHCEHGNVREMLAADRAVADAHQLLECELRRLRWTPRIPATVTRDAASLPVYSGVDPRLERNVFQNETSGEVSDLASAFEEIEKIYDKQESFGRKPAPVAEKKLTFLKPHRTAPETPLFKDGTCLSAACYDVWRRSDIDICEQSQARCSRCGFIWNGDRQHPDWECSLNTALG